MNEVISRGFLVFIWTLTIQVENSVTIAFIQQSPRLCRLFNYLFRRLCNLVFRQVDYNGNGVLDALEVEVCALTLVTERSIFKVCFDWQVDTHWYWMLLKYSNVDGSLCH